MKKLICLFLILFSSTAIAATGSGNISSVTSLGGVNLTDSVNIPNSNADGYFTIYGGGSLTAINVAPLYKNGVAYQVPSGKTFVASKICILSGQATTRVQLLSATASFAHNVGAGTLTGPVYMAGVTDKYPLLTLTANVHTCFSSFYSFTQNVYTGYQADTATGYSITVTGKEI